MLKFYELNTSIVNANHIVCINKIYNETKDAIIGYDIYTLHSLSVIESRTQEENTLVENMIADIKHDISKIQSNSKL